MRVVQRGKDAHLILNFILIEMCLMQHPPLSIEFANGQNDVECVNMLNLAHVCLSKRCFYRSLIYGSQSTTKKY